MTGISSASEDVPNFVSYVNAFMREKTGPQAAWSSFALNKNVATDVHCDHHNLPGSPSYTITFGDFTGGGIWIHDENVEEHKRVMRRDPNGNELKGYVVSTQGTVHQFDGRKKHATEAWTGDRWCLTCFVTRGFRNFKADDKDRLRALRFPLRQRPDVQGRATGGSYGGQPSAWLP